MVVVRRANNDCKPHQTGAFEMALLEINWKPSDQELRQFAGIWFPLACGVICYFIFQATGAWYWPALLGSIATILAVTAFLIPAVAQRLFVAWMMAAFPIGWTVSHVLLGLIYFLLITPLGLVMRWCGRDALGRKFEPQRASYWIPHQTPQDKKRYFRQY